MGAWRRSYVLARVELRNFPQFGHFRRADFLLAEGVDHLNHGGYGATPRSVLDGARAWQQAMEADPSTFFRRDLAGLLRRAADRVAAFLGGRGEDWAFVENATSGLNAVIASLALGPGDELLCLSQVYGAIGNALSYHAGRSGARLVQVDVPVPFVDPAPLLEALAAAIGPRSRLAVFDHITSAGAVVLPIREMAALCHRRGVPVAIDGAHAPGQIALDVPRLGVDWYVGNLHKWAFAAKGTAVIWCAPEHQKALHPRSRTLSATVFPPSSTTPARATIRPGSPSRRRSIISMAWAPRRCAPITPLWRARPGRC
ncbi:MAG TPA: aminotransferase class V-fold PLP-dependent enzyme [Stellaceae bacterium]